MEIVDTSRLRTHERSGTVKLVPVLAERMAATLFFVRAGTATPRHANALSDEIHVVLRGSGRVRAGGRGRRVAAGSLVLVRRGTCWSYAAPGRDLALLSVSVVKDCPPKGQRRGE